MMGPITLPSMAMEEQIPATMGRSGLIASYVSISVQTEIVVNEAKTVALQADFFDKIFPKLCTYCWNGKE